MGPIWGRQDPGGSHVGPMNFAIWAGLTSLTAWVHINIALHEGIFLAYISYYRLIFMNEKVSLIARIMRPTWGPSGADRTHVGPMLAPWTLLSGLTWHLWKSEFFKHCVAWRDISRVYFLLPSYLYEWNFCTRQMFKNANECSESVIRLLWSDSGMQDFRNSTCHQLEHRWYNSKWSAQNRSSEAVDVSQLALTPAKRPRLLSWFHERHDIYIGKITGNSNICYVACAGSHQMKHQSFALLALCKGNPSLTNGALSQRANNEENVSIYHFIMTIPLKHMAMRVKVINQAMTDEISTGHQYISMSNSIYMNKWLATSRLAC